MEDPRTFEPYTLHVFDLSYYSGKMQAYLAYKGIPHRVHEIGWLELARRIAPRTGLVEVPVLERADGVLMRDSTAMIEWFEKRYTDASVLPEDPAAAYLCRLLEDYADEGLWRPAMYYRWAFAKDARLNARRFVEDFMKFPLTPAGLLRYNARRRQQRTYIDGLGVTAANRADVERHYRDELADLETVLQRRPFLFGERPSLADFGYFASMFRHFSIDPTPARIMRNEAPAVYEWAARLWNARAERLVSGAWAPLDGGLPEGIAPLLRRAARRYLPDLHANARAVAAGALRYSVTLDGKEYRQLPATPFQAWRRAILQRDLAALDGESSTIVRKTLADLGCLAWLERDGVLPVDYPDGDLLPLCAARTLGPLERLRFVIAGTPHHRGAAERRGMH
jgi:glutathione S-transferase